MTDAHEQPAGSAPAADVLHTGEAGGRVVRGGAIRVAGFGVGVVFGLATSALLLRHLGVVDYGKYGTVAALLGIVLALSDGGLTAIGARELSTTPAGPARTRMASTLMLLRLVTTLGGVAIAIAFAAFAYGSAQLTLGATLVGASIVLISMQSMATIPLLVTLRIAPVTGLEVLRHALTFAGILALVLAEAGLEAFFAVQIPIAALLLLLTVVYVRRTLPIGLRASGAAVRRLARETLPLAVASTMIVLYGGAMVIIVSLVASDYQTGLFVTSARVMEVVVGLPALVIALALPVLSVASTTDHERLRNALQLMVELGLVLAALVAVTLALAADGVIAVIGGSAFAEAAPILQVQAFAIVGVFLSQTLQNALVSLRQQQTLIITNAVALAAVIGLGVVLVSRLGAIGGAWAILAAEALLCLLLVVTLLRRAPQVLPTFRFAWKVVACLAIAGAVALVPLGSAWLSAVLGGLAFAILAGLLRAVPVEAIVALASPVWGEERVRGGLRRYYGAA
jgi:O-antigen/teichoic acid export membrane protein